MKIKSEIAELASNTLRIMGHVKKEIVLGTDNSANLALALGTAAPSRSKPDLIHWAPLRDRIRRKVIAMVKVATASNRRCRSISYPSGSSMTNCFGS